MFAFEPCQGRAPREDGVDYSFIVSCRQSGGIGHADIVRRLIMGRSVGTMSLLLPRLP